MASGINKKAEGDFIMKKILSLLIALFMIVGSIAILTACSGGGGCNVCVDTDGDGICENCDKKIEDDDDGKDDGKGDGEDDEDEVPVEITADNWDDLFKFQNVTITMVAEEDGDTQNVSVKINGTELQMVMEDSNGSMTYYTDGKDVYMNGAKLEGVTADDIASFYQGVIDFTGAFSEFTKQNDGSFVMGDDTIIVRVTNGGKLDTVVIHEEEVVINVTFSDWNKTTIDKDYVADNPINGGGSVSPEGPDDSGNTDITDKPGEEVKPNEGGKPGADGGKDDTTDSDDPGVSEEDKYVEINEDNWNDLFIFKNVTITLVARVENEEQTMIVKISGKEIQVTKKGSNNSVVYYTDGKDVYMNGKLFTGATPKQLESMYRDIIDFTDVYDSFTKVSDERFIGKGIPVEINIRNGRLDLVTVNDEDFSVTATFSDWGNTVASKGEISDDGGDGGITDTEFGKLTEEEWKKLFDYDNVTIETAIYMNGEETHLLARIDGSKILLYMSTKNGEATLFTDGKKVYLEGYETDDYTPATVYLIATASANYSEYFNYFTQIDENKFYSESEGIELYLKDGRLFESFALDGNDSVMVWYTDWGTTVVDKNDSNDPEINCKHYDNDNDGLCDECYQPVKNGGNDVVDKITEESWKNLFVFDNVSIKMEYSAEGESACRSIQICGDRILYQEFDFSGYKCDVYYDGKTVYLNGVETSAITLENIYSWFIKEIDFSKYYDLFINEGGNRFYSEDLGLTIFVEAGKLQNIYYDDDIYSFRADFFEWGNTIINYTPNSENKTDCAHNDYDKDGDCDYCGMPMPSVDTDTCAHSDYDKDGKCDNCSAPMEITDEDIIITAPLNEEAWKNLFNFENVTVVMYTGTPENGHVTYILKIDGKKVLINCTEPGSIFEWYTDGRRVYVNGEQKKEWTPDFIYTNLNTLFNYFDFSEFYSEFSLSENGNNVYVGPNGRSVEISDGMLYSTFVNMSSQLSVTSVFSDWGITEANYTPSENETPDRSNLSLTYREWVDLFAYENVTIKITEKDFESDYVCNYTFKINGFEILAIEDYYGYITVTYTDGEDVYVNGNLDPESTPSDLYSFILYFLDYSDCYEDLEQWNDTEFYCDWHSIKFYVYNGILDSFCLNDDGYEYEAKLSDYGNTEIDPNEGIDLEWAAMFEFDNVSIELTANYDGESGTMKIRIDGDRVYIEDISDEGHYFYYTDGTSVYVNGAIEPDATPSDIYGLYMPMIDFSTCASIFAEVEDGVYYSEEFNMTIVTIDGQIASISTSDFMGMSIEYEAIFSSWGTTVID